MKQLLDKAFFKMLLGFVAILVVGLASIFAISFFESGTSPEGEVRAAVGESFLD